MNYSKLKFLLTQRKLSIRKLAEMLDYSEAGFHTMIKRDKIQVNTLEKIAEILEINPIIRSFFIELFFSSHYKACQK